MLIIFNFVFRFETSYETENQTEVNTIKAITNDATTFEASVSTAIIQQGGELASATVVGIQAATKKMIIGNFVIFSYFLTQREDLSHFI